MTRWINGLAAVLVLTKLLLSPALFILSIVDDHAGRLNRQFTDKAPTSGTKHWNDLAQDSSV